MKAEAGRGSALSGHWESLEDLSARFHLPPILEHELWYFRALHAQDVREALAAADAGVARVPSAAALAWRGRLRRLSGDRAGAVDDWRRALEREPELPQAHLWLGESGLGTPESDASLSRALAAAPDLHWALLYRGAGRLLRGDAPAAQKDLEACLRAREGSLGRLLAGLAAEAQGKKRRALAHYARAGRLEPTCSAAHLLRARARSSAAAEARAMDDALDAEPTYALITLSWYRPGNDWRRHLNRLRRFAFEEPERAQWYYRQQEDRYAPYHFQEYEDSRRLALDKPGRAWAEALVGRGACRCPPDLGRAEEGGRRFDRAIRRRPWAGWIYAWRALSRLQRRDTQGALADFAACLRLQPQYHRAHAWRGALLRKLGRPLQALADLDKAVAVDEQYAFALHERSLARRALEDWAGAAADLDRAFLLDSRYAWVFAVGREPSREEWDAAGRELDRAVAAQPRSASLRQWRGHCRLRQGLFEQAYEELLLATQLDPASACAQALFGRALFEGGQDEEACRRLARALELDSGLAIAYGWKAEAEFRLGRSAEAFALLERARRRQPTVSWIYAQKAEFLLRLERPRPALNHALRAIRLEGRHADQYRLLAQIRLALADPRGAESAVARALTISPNLGQAYVIRAEARRRLGRAAEVVEDYRTILSRFPFLFNEEQRRAAEALLNP